MALNRGALMTLSSAGGKPRTGPHRLRMPWMVAKEKMNTKFYRYKDKSILDGTELFSGWHRKAQLEPIAALNAVVAQRKFNVQHGKNLFQVCVHLPFDGRGQRLYRKDWMEGTMEKYVTLTSVVLDRENATGTAYGYITFHGESTVRPVKIENAEFPGWEVEYRKEWEVGYDQIVPPPPSIGYDIPVNPKQYKLKAYPCYDPPNPPQFVEQLLKDRGVIPDVETTADDSHDDQAGDNGDGSVPHTPK